MADQSTGEVASVEALKTFLLEQQRRSMQDGPDATQVRSEAIVRSLLAARVAALPPSAVVSRDALLLFKRQHIAMMTRSDVPGTASIGQPAVMHSNQRGPVPLVPNS